MNQMMALLKGQFRDRVSLHEKRPGIWQVAVPLFHEDGDMVDLYVETVGDGRVRVCDHGMTLQRLSYALEDMTPARERVLGRILAESGVAEEEGDLRIEVPVESLVPAVLQLAQTEARVCAMRLYRREVIASLFAEQLDDFVSAELAAYSPLRNVVPLAEREDLEVDWSLVANGRVFYVCGVRDVGRARLTTIAFLEFQRARLPFRGVVVHEDMTALPRKDQVRITSAADKQFPSLDDFRAHAAAYLDREAA
jgi:hypothetical protein